MHHQIHAARHNATVPQYSQPTKRAPMSVREAIAAFGNELRQQLIHYYWRHPSNQADAAASLGANLATVSKTTRELVALGVLRAQTDPDDGRARIYTVNEQRVAELIDAQHEYLQPPDATH